MVPKDSAQYVTHYNTAPYYINAHPEWVHDSIPACDNDGDKPTDLYTLTKALVTCQDCRAAILAADVDAGKVCPHCKRGDGIKTVRGLDMPMFACGCGASWFDHVTMASEVA